MRRLALLLALAGCGSGTVTADEFPAAFARAVCQVHSRCATEAPFVEQQCEADSTALYAPDLAKALAAGRSGFDAAQAQACLDGLQARGCGRTPPEVDQACQRAVAGKVPTGQPCNWLFECVEGLCEPNAGTCPATCAAVAHEGESCNDRLCDQRAGLRCVENVCVRPRTVGQTCGSSADCATGLYCDGFSQCSTPGFEQAACSDQLAAADPLEVLEQCGAGLFCDGACRRRAASGQACTASSLDAVRFACGDGLLCRGFSLKGPTPGTCAAPGGIGAPCATGADVTGCAEGFACVNGSCADKPVSGPCTSSEDCKDGVAYCNGGQCVPVPPNDASGACHEP